MKWEFTKTMIKGYGMLSDPKGKDFNVNFEDKENIIVTTTKQCRIVKVPDKVIKMIKEKIQ
jgi:hypothetical protein